MADADATTELNFDEPDSDMGDDMSGPCPQHSDMMRDIGNLEAHIKAVDTTTIRMEAAQIKFQDEQRAWNDDFRKEQTKRDDERKNEITKLFVKVCKHSTFWGLAGAIFALAGAKIMFGLFKFLGEI